MHIFLYDFFIILDVNMLSKWSTSIVVLDRANIGQYTSSNNLISFSCTSCHAYSEKVQVNYFSFPTQHHTFFCLLVQQNHRTVFKSNSSLKSCFVFTKSTTLPTMTLSQMNQPSFTDPTYAVINNIDRMHRWTILFAATVAWSRVINHWRESLHLAKQP